MAKAKKTKKIVKKEKIEFMNRFFKTSDTKEEQFIFPLDLNFFWSRLYEYPFALNCVDEKDVVLDLACGTYHPLKFALAQKCSDTHACDLEYKSNDDILRSIEQKFGKEEFQKFDKNLITKSNMIKADICKLPYRDNMFDKIVCISALEHMSIDVIKKGLSEIKRCLKDDGKVILTLDYPTILPEKILELIDNAGFKVHGDCDYMLDSDCIESSYFGGNLKCYYLILEK